MKQIPINRRQLSVGVLGKGDVGWLQGSITGCIVVTPDGVGFIRESWQLVPQASINYLRDGYLLLRIEGLENKKVKVDIYSNRLTPQEWRFGTIRPEQLAERNDDPYRIVEDYNEHYGVQRLEDILPDGSLKIEKQKASEAA